MTDLEHAIRYLEIIRNYYGLNKEIFDLVIRTLKGETDEVTPPARVLSLDELRALPLGAVVWEEYKQDDGDCAHVAPTLVTEEGKMMTNLWCQHLMLDQELLKHAAEGYQQRYWDREPTEKQMEAIEWASN